MAAAIVAVAIPLASIVLSVLANETLSEAVHEPVALVVFCVFAVIVTVVGLYVVLTPLPGS